MRDCAVWTTENGEPTGAPPLQELSEDDWDMIIEDVMEHFVEEGEDEYIEMALLDQQPHWQGRGVCRKGAEVYVNG